MPIDNQSAWDCYAGALLLMEYLIDGVADHDWPATRARLEAWDAARHEAERKA